MVCNWHAKLACASRTLPDEFLPSCPLSSNSWHRPLVHCVRIQINYSGLYDALILFCGDLVARWAHEWLAPGREEHMFAYLFRYVVSRSSSLFKSRFILCKQPLILFIIPSDLRIQTIQLCSIHCPPPRVPSIIPLCEGHARVPTISFLIASACESSSRPKKWKLTRLKGLLVSACCLASASSR
ncbi:hypothetical protein AZE42_07471 [Rhizopogon vesiculosus]|uniref:Uncharacterized protein n=1 Tax=Rhizopogon vesiculosus TaxID=180088 RepID=A0A1J8QIP2_9AGAM|nr:hypothetical protein AZE42_07471 [Rhizopogon vesiculosus]